jgi:acyl-coenzyme A synthetase/AMP-(fatty) acid ligase
MDFVDALPRNSMGKVRKSLVIELLAQRAHLA